MNDNKHLTYDDIVANPDLVALDALERDGSGELADYILPQILCDDGGVIEWRLTHRTEPVDGWFCSATDVNTDYTCYVCKISNQTDATCADNTWDVSDDNTTAAAPFDTPAEALEVILEIATATGDEATGKDENNTSLDGGNTSEGSAEDEGDFFFNAELERAMLDDYRSKRLHLYSRVVDAACSMLGVQLVNAAYGDYGTFRAAFRRLTVDTKSRGIETTYMSNALLCLRYPFLVPYNLFDGRVCWDGFHDEQPFADGGESADASNAGNYMSNPLPDGFDYPACVPDDENAHTGRRFSDTFARTHFDAIESGWQRRFGLDMMEDIRLSCYDPEYNNWLSTMLSITVEQIKEKYGTLRFYIMGGTERTNDVIDIYEDVSNAVCVRCGRAYGVRMSRGWIVPECFVCSTSGRTRTSHFEESETLAEWAGDAYDDMKRYTIGHAYEMDRFINATNASSWTADGMDELHRKWVHTFYDGDGKHEVNKAVGFLDASLAPNGDKWRINSVIDGIAWELREFDKTLENGWHAEHYSDYDIHDALDILGRDITPWYPIDDDGSNKDSRK